MKKALALITIICTLQSCNNVKEFKVDKNLTTLEHKQGATTKSLALKDFSIAKGTEEFFGENPLTLCNCFIDNDSLYISIGYRSESVKSPKFTIYDGQYKSETTQYSDIPEYNNEYSLNVKTYEDELTLNNYQFSVGDTLIGHFKLKTEKISFEDWNRSIVFKGSFQCIIQ